MRSSGRRRSRACRRTRAPRSNPRRSRRRCWRPRAGAVVLEPPSGRWPVEPPRDDAGRRGAARPPRRTTPPPCRAAERPAEPRLQPAPADTAPAPPPAPAESAPVAAGALVPLPRRTFRSRAAPIPAGHSDRPGARRSRDRRRGAERRIRGTNRPAQGPGRRLARIFVPLGRRNPERFRANRRSLENARPRFSCQSGPSPDIRCAAFRAMLRTPRLVRRNSSVGRARHS